ncbi:prevent-host-death protein [Myroides sp.]|jgi:antitoxin YefM|uniref:prevent-host-death protein n=1 Tax=Myroides sp. TaxID=1874736 RepID=UPI0028A7FF15|nr:prevent-host-death protein [Myroides sp.]
MLVVSSREFRDKQAMYLDQADEGKEILVQRGKNRSYRIVPITEDDTIVKKEHILAPDERLAQAISPDELLERLIPRIEKLFDK